MIVRLPFPKFLIIGYKVLAMYALQLLEVLVVGASLALATVSETNRCVTDTCTVMACGNPGLNGLPGRDGKDGAKGEKGDPGVQVRGQQGPPGKAGPPGTPGMPGARGIMSPPGQKGQKGQKGEATAIDTIQTQVATLEKMIQTLQEELRKTKKIVWLQGAVSVGEKIFVSTGQQNTFSGGRDLCAHAGGALASSRNAAENRALTEIVKQNSNYVNAFLDINDIRTEGKFVYLNGAPVGYTNWKQGEPNDYNNNEDCVILQENQLWNDISCEYKSLIICEV